ncbi:MAG: outer membrane beta-barrel protein [Rhodomicrobium sp.]
MLRNSFIGLASSLALISAANAADMYVPGPAGGLKDVPVYEMNWSGFYAGVNGGYGVSGPAEVWTGTFGGTAFLQGAGAEPAGGFGGAQIGYNWEGIMSPRVVLGVEADIQGAGISDSRAVTAAFIPVPIFGVPVTNETNVDWFGTVRGRIGYSVGTSLLYVTGGLAYGDVDDQVKAPLLGLGSILKRDQTEVGYVVGAGVEVKISPAWSVKAEYQYIDFGSQNLAPVGAFAGSELGTKSIDTNINTVRAGLNYHVGSVYEPLK